ncbi:unnamed protein product [Miscanthus lutarioriparius]|uniref:DUF3615 domain-containing protein n=1 Tax=Miscanthus lutarioriparius TaxID=422564 RepID=A0A811QF43_9POAL|nr:unnamed protein product [Miscanthus lutarioriparius]
MPKRLRPRSAAPAIRRGPSPIEIPAPLSLRPPRRSRSLPLSVKTWVNISPLQDPGEGYSPRIGSGQALQESLRDTATTSMSSGSEAYSDQQQKASGAHEAVLEHVAAQNIMLAEAALTHFNAENPEEEYMLVTDDGTKAPISRVFVHDGPWFHCNFSARAKNDNGGNRVVQFYAEIFYAETPRVMRCCVLTNVAESYPDRTCGFCGGNAKRDGILHPPDVLGYKNWLGLANGVDSFARHVHKKPDHSRRRPMLEQFQEVRI